MYLETRTNRIISVNVLFHIKIQNQHFRTKITSCQILGEMVREAMRWTILCFTQQRDWISQICIVDADDKALIVSS